MNVEESQNLTSLIEEFIIYTLDWKTGYSEQIYEILDKISLNAQKETDMYINNEVYEEAAKLYLLIYKALIDNVHHVKDDEVTQTIIDAALSWQSQAERILNEAVQYYSNKAFNYEQEGDYERYTEFMNKARNLEYQIQIGSLLKELESDVSTNYLLLRTEAYSEWGVRKARSISTRFVKGLRRLFRREHEVPSETLPEPVQPLPPEESDFPIKPTFEAKSHITPEKITIDNDAEPSRARANWYNWSVYLVADDDVMNQIESVTYTLHPTFPQPKQKIEDPAEGFKLNASGWGEFQIKVEIHLKDADTITKYHWLNLGGREKK